jgi:hypothetical protein
MSPFQRLKIYLLATWHSIPTLHQHIEHIKFFYLRWLTYRTYPAHWLRNE